MIEVNDLSFSYNKNKKILKGITFSIEKGSWTSIIGHNGSGKSTLAKLLVGLLPNKKGSIVIDDIELNTENLETIRKKIGIVFQNPENQFVGITVKHDIAFGLENSCIPISEMKDKINYYSALVGMLNFLDREPHQLSGGEKQRVALAGALAMEKDIFIFDEATSMLDPKGVREVEALIKMLNKEMNKTVITITHDLSFASLSDKVIVLNHGEVVLNDTSKNVFSEKDILINSGLSLTYIDQLIYDLKDSTVDSNILEALCELSLKK
jgi:energy-coupling factor transport system ATP-binding protein